MYNIINLFKQRCQVGKINIKKLNCWCQSDPRWGALKIGETNLTLAKDGCYIVSISMLLNKTPDIVLAILNRNRCFNAKGELINDLVARVLKMKYSYTAENPNKICICETNHYIKVGFPQHFFVNLNNGSINDPLTGTTKKNPYNIVSYRLWDMV